MKTIHIAIGNSDDELTQAEWSAFTKAVDTEVRAACAYAGTKVHGCWHSLPNAPWQNACWSIGVTDDMAHVLTPLRLALGTLCYQYRQDSIAWTLGDTEFIAPTDPVDHAVPAEPPQVGDDYLPDADADHLSWGVAAHEWDDRIEREL